jgi:hypothetical protein
MVIQAMFAGNLAETIDKFPDIMNKEEEPEYYATLDAGLIILKLFLKIFRT